MESYYVKVDKQKELFIKKLEADIQSLENSKNVLLRCTRLEFQEKQIEIERGVEVNRREQVRSMEEKFDRLLVEERVSLKLIKDELSVVKKDAEEKDNLRINVELQLRVNKSENEAKPSQLRILRRLLRMNV